MPITVVVGGQYGGEGKGLISSFIALKNQPTYLVKTGGPNSAHSLFWEGKRVKVRMLPTAAGMLASSTVVFPAGCLIFPKQLFKEIEEYQFKGKILIDPQAGIISEEIIHAQNQDTYYQKIGSSLTGTGYAMSERSKRRLSLAKEIKILQPYCSEVIPILHKALHNDKRILVEGCQGFGLSNYHGDYPYCSSRDNTVNALMAQLGIGPKYLDEIILVVKCFPTRNQIGEGRLSYELSEEFIQRHSHALNELGGGSYQGNDLPRRVGMFDERLFTKAIMANSPTSIALTGIDKLEKLLPLDQIKQHYHSKNIFLKKLQSLSKDSIHILSKGPAVKDVGFIKEKSF